MKLTETEKQALAWCIDKAEPSDYYLVNPVCFDVPIGTIEISLKTLKRGLDGLIRKNILMSYHAHKGGVYIEFNAMTALLAYNGIFSDTLTDPSGNKYTLTAELDE